MTAGRLQHWAHRLHGSGSTLGFDAAAAALAGWPGWLPRDPEGAPLPAVRSALAEAGAALARGERLMAARVPGFAAGGTPLKMPTPRSDSPRGPG